MNRVAAIALTIALGFVGCGGKSPRAPVGLDEAPPRVVARRPSGAPPVSGHVITSVPEHTIGPYAARRDASAGLVAWVTPPEGSGRRIVVVTLAGNGAPRGGERTVSLVPNDTTALAVGTVRGQRPGFVLAWTALTDRGEALWTAVLGDDGVARGKAVELARTTDDIVWMELVPTATGAVCLWAEETRGGDADLSAAALDVEGKVRTAPASVARGVIGWHVLETPTGPAVSTVTPARGARAGKVPEGTRGGTLSFVRLDPDGHALSPPVLVTKAPSVSGDVEVAAQDGGYVFAWTDRTGDEPFVAAAAVDPRGTVDPPRKIVDARGGSALLHVASGAGAPAVMWEAPIRAKGDARRVHVARFATGATLDRKRFVTSVVGRSPPELAASGEGFAILGGMHDCDEGAPSCAGAPILATLVRLDAELDLVQREPVRFLDEVATLAWGLRCDGQTCLALSASPSTPPRVRATEVLARVNVPRRASPPVPSGGPRVADVTAFATNESVLDLAAAKVGNQLAVATLSTKGENKTGTAAAVVRFLDEAGHVASETTVSTRALAVGGTSVTALAKPDDGAAVAWVSRDEGDPEVHVARIDKRGKIIKDVRLTRAKGDAAHVAIGWAGTSLIAAWIDGRDGNGEVYVAKLSPDLGRLGRDERITNAPGDASDLSILSDGDRVWLAWADSRDNVRAGKADVFAVALRTRDLKPLVAELRLLATTTHSRSPKLAASEAGGVVVAWIEEAPLGSETPSAAGYGAMWAAIDAAGKVVERAAKLPQGDGAATSVAIDTKGGLRRVVVARSTDDAVALDVVDVGASPPVAYPLLTLDGPPSLDVALVLKDDVAFFNDDGPMPADRRARRAKIAWAP